MEISEKSKEKVPTRRTWTEIDLNAIAGNVRILKQWYAPVRIMTAIKSDGYGHGLIAAAQAASVGGADSLGIAAVEEGIALREAGIQLPIVLICPVCPDNAPALIGYNLTANIGDPEIVEALGQEGRKRGIRPEVTLEIDTGMGRYGVRSQDAEILWRQAVAAGLDVVGLSTHFSEADNAASDFSARQIEEFCVTYRRLQMLGADFRDVSLSASHGMMRFREAGGNLVRPGLMIYGVAPKIVSDVPDGLRPALALKARIATIRELPAGWGISYGRTHILSRSSRVATALIGYGDGYPRRLSNIGTMLVRGRHAPILGRVCMDQTVIDVTDIPDAVAGDEAVCIGQQGNAQITATDIARQIGTIEHEVLTAFLPRVHRIYSPLIHS
jgi:alanine racemase